MTIPKRDKRKRGGLSKALPKPPSNKMVKEAPADKEIKTPFPFYTRVCPYCGQGTLTTICQKCGRLTVFRNKIK